MPLVIDRDRVVPDSELTMIFVRASGPGGQNVNKVASAVQLRFDLAATAIMSESAKARLRVLAGRRVTDDGALLIIARNHRTQEGNRREALERLRELILKAMVEPRTRHATRPTRASKARRLKGKIHQGGKKQLRGRVSWED